MNDESKIYADDLNQKRIRILHMLGWQLKEIVFELEIIAKQGFNAIQINVLQPSKEAGLKPWWMSYQPIKFEVGNYYGNKKDLQKLCKEAKKYHLKIIVDVICNHTASQNHNPLLPHEKVDSILLNNPEFWKEPKPIQNYQNRFEVINYCINLPGLNTNNPILQNIIIKFLKALIDCGVAGFRFDAAKHIALPSEGCNFWPNVISSINQYQKDLIVYGEVIFEHDPKIIDEYCKYMMVLTDRGGTDINKMIYFYESHDTYLSDDIKGPSQTRKKSSLTAAKKYRDLNKKYPNTIYYIRPNDNTWKSDLIRKANEVEND